MSSASGTNHLLRRLGVGAITLLIAAPIAFVLFAMGLMVAELVMFPLATLVIGVVTGVIASLTAGRLVADGLWADVDKVVGRNLAWVTIPAALSVVYAFMPQVRPIWVVAAVLVYSVVIATRLAFRHRTAEGSIGKRLTRSAVWLAGTGLAMAGVILVASLFGLTGA